MRALSLVLCLACGESSEGPEQKTAEQIELSTGEGEAASVSSPPIGLGITLAPAPELDPSLELVPVDLKIVLRPARSPEEGVLRVTGYGALDPETGQAPVGTPAMIHHVVPLSEATAELELSLDLAPGLYYQASFGPGTQPQAGDWVGPMMQWSPGQERFFLLLSQIRLESGDQR